MLKFYFLFESFIDSVVTDPVDFKPSSTTDESSENQLKPQKDDTNSYFDSLKTRLKIGGVIAGEELIRNAFSSGDITGRKTLYHGTNIEDASRIRKEGLLPTIDSTAGVTKILSHDPERYAASLGKAYTTPSRLGASSYSISSDFFKENPITKPLNDADQFILADKRAAYDKQHIPTMIKRFITGDGIVKINAPTWKMKTVINPEVDMPFSEWMKKSYIGSGNINNPLTKLLGKSAYNQLRDYGVFDGGVGTEYIKGSNNYQKLTREELIDYIKNNPGRFGKGILKFVGGAGLLAAGAYGLKDNFNN